MGVLLTLPALCRGFSPLQTTSRTPPVTGHLIITTRRTSSQPLFLSSNKLQSEQQKDGKTDASPSLDDSENLKDTNGNKKGVLQTLLQTMQLGSIMTAKRPPLQVDDPNLMLYDVFLIVNMAVSISFWVTHRMDFTYIGVAFNEGCLLSILWMVSGLYTGAFLYSAVDGHYASSDDRAGPKAAGLLGFHTFLNAVNLRLVVALVLAVVQHRAVGAGLGEDVLPLEIGFGFCLMSAWRSIHSSSIPRL